MEVITHNKGVKNKSSKIYSIKNAIQEFVKTKDLHKIWNNPLLIAIQSGLINLNDFKYLFSQYYFYSKNFTKLLAAAMIKCDSDYYRSKIISNLWDEDDIGQRPAEIFRKFLIQSLNVDVDNIVFESCSESFFHQYLSLCLSSEPAECAAILSFGTENITTQLFKIMKKGLLDVGLKETDLHFFNIHITENDRFHILEEILLSYRHEPYWLERCKQAIAKALDLRNHFFENIYRLIQFNRLSSLLERISAASILDTSKPNFKKLHQKLDDINSQLYTNAHREKNINFKVNRVPFETDVLDPKIIHIPTGFTNQYQSHAHETVFIVLSGRGEVIMENYSIKIKAGDLLFIPRWVYHQTINNSDENLVFFAITDYGLTKYLPQNSETVSRLNPDIL